MKQKKK
jgi:hypothetical protein